MKKLFKIAMALLFGLTVATSCGVNETGAEIFTTMATIVESSYSSTPYYIVFDDGKAARVTNAHEWNPAFPENVNELRYLVSYEVVNSNVVGYDLEVKIVSTTPITTGSLEYVTAADFTGDKGLQNYTAAIKPSAVLFATAYNYLTLMVYYQGENSYTVPKVRLVYNQAETSPYKDLYVENDGYLYLELYYDDSANEGANEFGTFRSFKVNNLQGIMNNYKGLKIISMSSTTNKPEVFTHEFYSQN